MIFLFHFHNIFVVTYYANISVMDTLIHVGKIKMLHNHTHLPLCVLTACGHWTMGIDTELSLIYRPRCTFIYWGLVTPIWWQNSCHQWFREWLVISLVPAIAWTNYDILLIGTLEVEVMLNYISNMNSLCCSNLLENVICKTVAILCRPWCFK